MQVSPENTNNASAEERAAPVAKPAPADPVTALRDALDRWTGLNREAVRIRHETVDRIYIAEIMARAEEAKGRPIQIPFKTTPEDQQAYRQRMRGVFAQWRPTLDTIAERAAEAWVHAGRLGFSEENRRPLWALRDAAKGLRRDEREEMRRFVEAVGAAKEVMEQVAVYGPLRDDVNSAPTAPEQDHEAIARARRMDDEDKRILLAATRAVEAEGEELREVRPAEVKAIVPPIESIHPERTEIVEALHLSGVEALTPQEIRHALKLSDDETEQRRVRRHLCWLEKAELVAVVEGGTQRYLTTRGRAWAGAWFN